MGESFRCLGLSKAGQPGQARPLALRAVHRRPLHMAGVALPRRRFRAKMSEEADLGDKRGQPEPCADDGGDSGNVLQCLTCGQKSDAWEMDKLPEVREAIKWKGSNKSRVTGRVSISGYECYPYCQNWAERRRSYPKDTQQEVVNKLKKDQTANDDWKVKRRLRVRGERRREAGASSETGRVEEIEKGFEETFDEGHFYELDSYINLVRGRPKQARRIRFCIWRRRTVNVL